MKSNSNQTRQPRPLHKSEGHGPLRPPKQCGSQSAWSNSSFALSAMGCGITPQGDATVPSPLAGWDRYASPFAGSNVTPRTSLATESAGLAAHRDGAPITSPARARPRRAIAALPRAFDGVRRSKPDSGGSVPAIDAPGPQSVMAGGGGEHEILRSVAAQKDSTQAPPPDAAQKAASAHSSVDVPNAKGRENLPSTYFVPMALRTRSAGQRQHTSQGTASYDIFDFNGKDGALGVKNNPFDLVRRSRPSMSLRGIASPRDKDPSRLALPYSLLAAPLAATQQSPRASMGGCNSMIMVGSGENAQGIDLGNGLTLRFGRKPQSPRNPRRHLNSDERYSYAFIAHQAGSRPETVNVEQGIPEAGGKMQVWTWEELEDESHFEEDSFSGKEGILQPLHHSTVVPRKSCSRLNDFQAQDTSAAVMRSSTSVHAALSATRRRDAQSLTGSYEDTLLMAELASARTLGAEPLPAHTSTPLTMHPAYATRARCTTKFTMQFAERHPHTSYPKGPAALVPRANFFRKISQDLTRNLLDMTVSSSTSTLDVLLYEKLDLRAFVAIFGPLWQRITLRDRESAGRKDKSMTTNRASLIGLLSLITPENDKPVAMSASWLDVEKAFFSGQEGVGAESKIRRWQTLQMAVDGETEPMCRDILVKSARMGHRPKPRPMKAVLMNGVTPRSKVAGVLMGTGKRDLVLLEKDDAQEVGNGEKAPLSGECGTGVEDGAAAVTGADGQEIGESRELEIVKGTAEKLEITGQTGTQAGNYVVDKRLFVLAEMQSLNVEYFALQRYVTMRFLLKGTGRTTALNADGSQDMPVPEEDKRAYDGGGLHQRDRDDSERVRIKDIGNMDKDKKNPGGLPLHSILITDHTGNTDKDKKNPGDLPLYSIPTTDLLCATPGGVAPRPWTGGGVPGIGLFGEVTSPFFKFKPPNPDMVAPSLD